MNQTNNNLMNHQRWNSAAKSLWIIALVIGICNIATTLLPLTLHEYPTMVETNMGDFDTNPHLADRCKYEMEMGYNPNDMTTILTIAILSFVGFVAQWFQFSYLGTLLNLMNKEQNSTYTHLKRYRLGLLITLISIAVMILLSLCGIILDVLHAGNGPEVAFTLTIIPLFGFMVGGILQFIGVVGMAFSDKADRNMSTGMKLMVSSFCVSILIAIISYVIIGSDSPDTIEMWLGNIPLISLAVPILQIAGWWKICKAENPYNE